MSWSSSYAIYLDINRPRSPLLDGKSSSPMAAEIAWTQGDQFPLRIYFQQRAQLGEASVNQQLPATHGLALGGKRIVNAGITGDLLVFADDFTEGQDGDDWYYEADINLHTQELLDLFASDNKAHTLQLDIEVQNASGHPLTYVVPVTIAPQAYGGEAGPANAIAAGGDSRAYADIDWTQTGNVDVAVPDGFILEELILLAEKDGATGEDLTGLVFDVGTTSDQDAYLAAEGPFTDLERYALDELTDGTVRIAITSAGSEGTDGRAILKGSRL